MNSTYSIRAEEANWICEDARPDSWRNGSYLLLGGADIIPFGGFDDSCPALAQGPTRLARGLAYAKYLNERHGARHETVVVEACGHNDRCMFTAKQALPLLFPRP